jgi:hypothetical protein
MKSVQFTFLVAAFTAAAAYQVVIIGKTMSAASPVQAVEADSLLPDDFVTSALPAADRALLKPEGETSPGADIKQAALEPAFDALPEPTMSSEKTVPDYVSTLPGKNFSVLAYYVFSEYPPVDKPVDAVLDTMKGLPVGTPIEEIKRASDAFGLDFNFMKAVAKIESGFNPKQRTGSYIGLFQLSNYEFRHYGAGTITDARDNAIAAGYKFATESLLFEVSTGRKPTFSDLYLIHQQGWQGAAEHVAHPARIAWKSMCATDEGKEKGFRWCKRAIWGNTLPAIKHVWKSVDRLTSSAFVHMWQQRIDNLYSSYSVADTKTR